MTPAKAAATPATQTDGGNLAEQHPNTWIPEEPGDELSGIVREVTRAWSDARNKGTGDGWYPLLKIERDDGQYKDFHAFTAVSYNRVMELQPVPGEHIVVTFTGVGKAKPNQSPPKLFTLRVDGRDPTAAANAVYARLGDGHLVNTPAPGRATVTAEGEVTDPGEFGF